MRLIYALVLLLTVPAFAQEPPKPAATNGAAAVTPAAAIVIDMSKPEFADARSAQALLDALGLALQRLYREFMAQPSVQTEQRGLQTAAADFEKKVLAAAGKDAKNGWTVEVTPATQVSAAVVRIVQKPKEAGK